MLFFTTRSTRFAKIKQHCMIQDYYLVFDHILKQKKTLPCYGQSQLYISTREAQHIKLTQQPAFYSCFEYNRPLNIKLFIAFLADLLHLNRAYLVFWYLGDGVARRVGNPVNRHRRVLE